MSRTGSLLPALALAALLAVGLPSPSPAQRLDAAGGAAVGLAGGAVVSLAVVTANARAGRFLRSTGEADWELLPVVAGGVAGGILGHRNPDRLWRSAGWGGAGMALGALAGAAVGRLVWEDSPGMWSGAVLGGAAGVVAGALLGALTWEAGPGADGSDPTATAPLGVRFRVPLGP